MKSIGEVIDEMKVISKRKYDFLKTYRNTLSEEEKEMLRKYEEEQAKQIYAPIETEPKPKPKRIQRIPSRKMAELFKKAWELNEKKELKVSDAHRKTLIALCQYFGRTDGPLNPKKGLLIMGGTGTGKTSTMRAFHTIGEYFFNEKDDWFMKFYWSNCIDVVEEYEDLSVDKSLFFQNYRGGVRLFDDFGQEADASRYGIKNIMREIIEKRYNYSHIRTYITTNLTEKQIRERYGQRVFSRIHEMFNIVPMIGEDHRLKL